MAKVLLKNVTKVFGSKVRAVDNLTLEIPDKGFISLLGPSGCGKTTTMRIIAGLEKPTSGKVYFDNEDVTDIHPRERDVAMVFQFPVLYPAISIFENIAFPLQARKIPKEEIKQRVNKIAKLFGLTKILSKRPRELDMGLKQRAVLARTFIRQPKICLLDEPLTNVDPKTRIELRTILKKMQSEFNETVVYVTHDQSESLTLADMIAVMDKGKLLQYDTPENIYETPANTFVAWFIGNPGMNFINCSFKKLNGKFYLNAKTFKYDITPLAKTVKKEASSDKLILGIRPEHIQISLDMKPSWIKSKCVVTEPLGNRMIIHLDIGDQQVVKAKSSSLVDISPGDTVWINFPSDNIRIFDGKSYNLIS